jgi:SPP1 gp7 family putative phage head morphogenesis protein
MNKDYWIDRQSQSLIQSELQGKLAIDRMRVVYNQALFSINNSINKIYTRYSTQTGLDVSELALIINGTEKAEYLQSLARAINVTGIKLDRIYTADFFNKLTRLEALKKQIYWELLIVNELEKNISTSTYTDVITRAYNGFRSDIRTLGGVQGSFSTLDRSLINQILKANWEGSNYSNRIWKNTRALTKVLQTELTTALTTGKDLAKVGTILNRRFQVGRYNSARLVRTETNHFHNQAELQGYEDEGVEKYEFVAVLDGRTSKICEKLDNKKFKVSEAIEGVNYPVMHPNCRSTTIPVVNIE